MLRVDGLSAAPGDAPLSFDIPNGQAVGLLGSDAAALSRIVGTIAGLRAPTAGSIRIDDIDVLRDPNRARSALSFCLPRAAHDRTSLREHLAVVAASRARRVEANAGIRRLGLDPQLRLNTPSSRAAAGLLAALLPDVPVVILHEPFRDVAEDTRTKAIDWIRSLAAAGTCVLVLGSQERDLRAVCHTVLNAGATR
jgi:ABC-2 type transport system ATP-binding protein